MAEFLNMGGYAVYVWPAYAASGLVLVGLGWLAHRFLRAQEEALRELDGSLDSGKADQ